MKFTDVVKLRRSVRKFSDRQVENEKIEQILESARMAPSWANKQCWSFIIVKDKEKIELLSKAVGVINIWLKKSPILIVACGDPKLSGIRNGIEYFTVDVAISMEHLILSAANLGLGSCWIGSFDEDRTKEILEIPDKIRVVAITPIGYPAEKAGMQESIRRVILRSKKRKPLNEIVHYDKW